MLAGVQLPFAHELDICRLIMVRRACFSGFGNTANPSYRHIYRGGFGRFITTVAARKHSKEESLAGSMTI